MLNFKKNLTKKDPGTSNAAAKKPVDLRQRLLQKEFDTLKQLPVGCQIHFDDPDVLHKFKLKVVPDKDSAWYGGRFEFAITVPEGYNFEVSLCLIALNIYQVYLKISYFYSHLKFTAIQESGTLILMKKERSVLVF